MAWPLHASGRDIAILSFLGAIQLALPCVLMVGAARHLAPQEIALLALLEVVLGPIWPWLSLHLLGIGEVPDRSTLVGAALVISALIFNELAGPRSIRTRDSIARATRST
jgi:drug/metabolite transporter (DMT)-like permease